MEGYIAEIRMFAGNFAPNGWAFCNGQILSIAQNTALFSLLGTTYGGDGQVTFALPNLVASALLRATIVTVLVVPIVVGAAYKPSLDTWPSIAGSAGSVV